MEALLQIFLEPVLVLRRRSARINSRSTHRHTTGVVPSSQVGESGSNDSYYFKSSSQHMVLPGTETTLSRGKSGSFHIALEPARGLDSRCMISTKRQEPISYRTSKFSSNRHRKLQPFRET